MISKNIETDYVLIFFLLLITPFFFFKLGQSSLVSWDEAWYAEIARNILKSGDFLHLSWNGSKYLDHPPVGFWLMAISMGFFGVSEFWARFPSAFFGMLCLVLIYLLGKKLFNPIVGLSSAVALSSAYWFLYRSRSGNLDIYLTMFFLLTFYLSVELCDSFRDRRKKDRLKYLLPLFILSLMLLFLTKTMVPLTIIPALIFVFYPDILKDRKNGAFLFIGLLLLIIILGLWFYSQQIYQDDFLQKYFMIGLPGVNVETNYVDNAKLLKQYLHSGIGKWFWPGILGLFVGFLTFRKNLLALNIFSLAFLLPFIFSNKGQIWHLIPVFPFMILSFFGLFYFIVEKTMVFLNYSEKPKLFGFKLTTVIASVLIFLFSCYYSFLQLKRSWYEFVDIPAYRSDEEILSREAGKYNYKFYIDGDFGPAAAFYSEKKVDRVYEGGLRGLFDSNEQFVIIVQKWRLDQAKVSEEKYTILKEDRDKMLVFKDNEVTF